MKKNKMKKNRMKYVLVALCILVLTGCSNVRFRITGNDKNPNSTNTPDINGEEDGKDQKDKGTNGNPEGEENGNEEKENVTDVNNLTNDGNKNTLVKPADSIEYTIYTVNSEAGIDVVVSAFPKDQPVTAELIVNAVVDSMAENSIMVGIENVTHEDDTVIVSFYKDMAPLNNVGAGYEYAILDAIAQSLTQNIETCSKVIYRAEGEAYQSGHIEWEIDEVYFSE